MKKTIRSLTVAAAVVVLAASAAHAQILVDGFYASADLGPSFVESLHYKNGTGKINTDPGVRGDLLFGCNFTPFFATELEVGGLANSLDTGPGQRLNAIAFDAELDQYPILGNIIFKAPLYGGVTPYIGFGAGGIASTLALRTTSHFWASDTDFTFAYQAKAGIDFAINRLMSVGVAYKFLGTMDHSWYGDDPTLFTHTSEAFNHSVLATFTIKF